MKVFCKYCQFYRGKRRMEIYTPLEPIRFTDHVCGVNNGSVWDFNRYNGCKYYQPLVKIGFWQKLFNKSKNKSNERNTQEKEV